MKKNASLLMVTMALGLLADNALAASPIKVKVELANPVLMAGKGMTTYLKVNLAGISKDEIKKRAPVNVALVLDRSSSMSGEKITQAKQAAIQAVEQLAEDDIVSIITYDTTVQVLMPATKVSSKEEIVSAIANITPRGSTALFAGVSMGAFEVKKFISDGRVNRIILLSDGQANVGPSSPEELGQLGASLAKEGISVTTIGLGLGYNEDLMVELAKKSDGNHAFVEDATQLSRIFNLEFGDLLSVAAKDVQVVIRCENGIKPLRVLGRYAEIVGNVIHTRLNQLYGQQDKFILVEIEIPAFPDKTTITAASVKVKYINMLNNSSEQEAVEVAALFTSDQGKVEHSINSPVMVAAVELIANEANKQAVALRDQGKVQEAKKMLQSNTIYLESNSARFNAPKLKEKARLNDEDSRQVESKDWGRQRKAMRKVQQSADMQQAW